MTNPKQPPKPTAAELRARWQKKRESLAALRRNIDRLRRQVSADITNSGNPKEQAVALAVRIMLHTSERVGNADSAADRHFGVTQLQCRHVKIDGSTITLSYTGKSGVKHTKSFSDDTAAGLLSKNRFQQPTAYAIRPPVSPDMVNRYLRRFDITSKDIRGWNANRMMLHELRRQGCVALPKDRPKVFNACLRKVAEEVGHGAPTLRKHYLLPEIEENFYKNGTPGRVNVE